MLPDPFNAPLVVASGSAATSPFTVIDPGLASQGKTIRHDITAAAGEPSVMLIQHQNVGKGISARGRHNMQVSCKPVVDGAEVETTPPFKFGFTIDDPKQGITDAQRTLVWNIVSGVLFGASGDAAYGGDQTVLFDRLINGES